MNGGFQKSLHFAQPPLSEQPLCLRVIIAVTCGVCALTLLISLNCLYYNEKDCSITILTTMFSYQAACANETLFEWFRMVLSVCQSSCCKEISQRKHNNTDLDSVFGKKIIFRTEISMSLCHRLHLFASSCITQEGPSVLDIRKESSHSVQYLVQQRLEELICGCFYEVGECAEWPLEENSPTAYWE